MVSAGSSGNFSALFDGQATSPEEQAFIMELKKRQKEEMEQHIILATA